MINGFSHVGVSTLDMGATIDFYEGILGLRRVVDNTTRIKAGGTLRQIYFDTGGGQYIVFMEPREVAGISSDYDPGINSALGLPPGMYHFAFMVSDVDTLEAERERIAAEGVDVSQMIDLGHAKSIFFNDPNNIQLEISCQTRDFEDSDLHQMMEADLVIPDK